MILVELLTVDLRKNGFLTVTWCLLFLQDQWRF